MIASAKGLSSPLENNESEFTKRYVMAHEFSHYLINIYIRDIQSQDSTGDQQCIDPLFPKKRSEMLADIMAAYIMFPYQAVLECMKNYVIDMKARNEYPIDVFEWMRVLGQRTQISPYFTISSYQYLKQLLCEPDIADAKIRNEYGELFR